MRQARPKKLTEWAFWNWGRTLPAGDPSYVKYEQKIRRLNRPEIGICTERGRYPYLVIVDFILGHGVSIRPSTKESIAIRTIFESGSFYRPKSELTIEMTEKNEQGNCFYHYKYRQLEDAVRVCNELSELFTTWLKSSNSCLTMRKEA